MQSARETFLLLQDVFQIQREHYALTQVNNLLLGVLVGEMRRTDPTFVTRLRLRIHAKLEVESDPQAMRNLRACQEWLADAQAPFMRQPCQ